MARIYYFLFLFLFVVGGLVFVNFNRNYGRVSGITDPFYKKLSTSPSEWNLETSGASENISFSSSGGYQCTVGGYDSLTHYARIRYRLPEKLGITPTKFYMKVTIDLPSDFYSQQKAGFRIINTDNYGTLLNKTLVGAKNADELRAGIHIYKDHLMRVIATHENHPNKLLWTAKTQLATGLHTLEFYGDVAEVAPWYLKIDGKVVASGNDRLSPDSVPVDERVITRLTAGIDGAAEQDQSMLSYIVKDFEISNSDPSSQIVNTLNVTNPTPKTSPAPTAQTQIFTPNPRATLTPSPKVEAVTNNSPKIRLLYPKNNASFSDRLYVVSTAYDENGISEMQIWINNKLEKTCNNSLCWIMKYTNSYPSGTYKIGVVARDKSPEKKTSQYSATIFKR